MRSLTARHRSVESTEPGSGRRGFHHDWRETFDTEGHGLLEIQRDFSDYAVKFMMVEMELRDERDNLEVIEAYWRNWLSSMGITQSEFFYSDGDAVDKIIEFMSQENEVEP